MAGIGFELRNCCEDSLLGLVQAYAYAGVIGSGPWVLSIVGMLLIGFLSARWWCRRSSSPSSGVGDLADRQLAHRTRGGAARLHPLGSPTGSSRSATTPCCQSERPAGAGAAERRAALGRGAVFVLSRRGPGVPWCSCWPRSSCCGGCGSSPSASGLKRYKEIVPLYALSYGLIVVSALLLRRWGLKGLLSGFVLGHSVLLVGIWLLHRARVTPDAARHGLRLPSSRRPLTPADDHGLSIEPGRLDGQVRLLALTPTSQPVIGLRGPR